ncbi:MAG: helix-turn-helix domain-containing protein [Pseudonocardiaceae bacterium]
MTERMTGGRDELSRTLRQLRQAAGLSGVEAGRRAGFSQAKVSRIENGVNVPTSDDVTTLAKVYDASADDRRRLDAIARDVRAEYRRVVLVKTPANFQQRMGRIEEASEHIATFTPTVVPGLLQTEPYARAIFSSADLTPSEIDKAVAARITRQQLLHDPGHRFTLITTAGALAWRAGTPEQMATQVQHIAESTRLPTARVGIIPWGARARVFPLHGWDLYDRRAVIVGTANATALLTEPTDVAVYADLFAQMQDMAIFDDDARAVLTRIAGEYRARQGDSESHHPEHAD